MCSEKSNKTSLISNTSIQGSVNGRSVVRLCTIVHFSCAFFPYFNVAIYIFSCCILFMLHFFILHNFYIVIFCVATFSCCTFFRVALFLCIALFHVALFHVPMFSFWIFLLLHSLHIAIFCVVLCSCCTISRVVTRIPTNI